MGTRKESCNNPQPPSAQTSYCSTRRVGEAHGSGNKRYPLKSQPRTGHTREPDPTHNELKHTTTRKTATRERTPDKPHVHTHTHTSRTENDAHQQTTPPRIIATLTQPLPRASALASETIACAISNDLSASASARCALPPLLLHLPHNCSWSSPRRATRGPVETMGVWPRGP